MYAVMIIIGIVVAVVICERRFVARGFPKGTALDLVVWAVPFGIVGARLYHVITDWQTYFGANRTREPIEALYIWQGGLGIWGAIAGGALGVYIAARRKHLSFADVADAVAPALAVAQAIGRWGNWWNQELYGGPTSLPWGLEIDRRTGRRTASKPPINRRSSTSRSGTSALPLSASGRTAASAWTAGGSSRCTSPCTARAGQSPRRCVRITRACWAGCGSTNGSASGSSSSPSATSSSSAAVPGSLPEPADPGEVHAVPRA